jgi:hypothetical protein
MRGYAASPVRYETTPILLQKGAVEKLVAMARQAEASLIAEFGAAAGYDYHRYDRRQRWLPTV